jgi:hypothetical protein
LSRPATSLSRRPELVPLSRGGREQAAALGMKKETRSDKEKLENLLKRCKEGHTSDVFFPHPIML